MIQRVNGSLAVSRALGDFEYKNNQTVGQCEQLVSPEPEVVRSWATYDFNSLPHLNLMITQTVVSSVES